MTDLELMEQARLHLDALAHGRDPLTGQPAPADDVINQVMVSQSLFYAAGVLQRLIEAGQSPAAPQTEQAPFCITPEQIAALRPDSRPLSATRIAALINDAAGNGQTAPLTPGMLIGWMTADGKLTEQTDPDGTRRRVPTEAGSVIGMEEQTYTSGEETRRYVVYSRTAQQYIFNHLTEIAEYAAQEHARIRQRGTARQYERQAPPPRQQTGRAPQGRFANRGLPWRAEDDSRLTELFRRGSSEEEISMALSRTVRAIHARLIRNGLIEDDTQ